MFFASDKAAANVNHHFTHEMCRMHNERLAHRPRALLGRQSLGKSGCARAPIFKRRRQRQFAPTRTAPPMSPSVHSMPAAVRCLVSRSAGFRPPVTFGECTGPHNLLEPHILELHVSQLPDAIPVADALACRSIGMHDSANVHPQILADMLQVQPSGPPSTKADFSPLRSRERNAAACCSTPSGRHLCTPRTFPK